MTQSIVHLSDPHFGGVADRAQIEAVEELVPDLEPRVIVLSGDLSQRARHGEYQAARALVRELERTAPVFVIPGNHDVEWWWRPFIPFREARKYRKYSQYFGPALAPTLSLAEALLVGVLTSHGVAWGSLTTRIRDIGIKGHLPEQEIQKAQSSFDRADAKQLRILVVHHNVQRGEISRRMGLARWKRVQQRIIESGAELVLCGHDHQERVGMLGDRVVVSCAGTLSTRSRGGRPSVFNRVCWDDDSIQVELYRWDVDRRLFKRSDVYAFARADRPDEAKLAAQVG